MRVTLATINRKVIIQLKRGCRKQQFTLRKWRNGERKWWTSVEGERRKKGAQKLQTATYAVCQRKMDFHMVQILFLHTAIQCHWQSWMRWPVVGRRWLNLQHFPGCQTHYHLCTYTWAGDGYLKRHIMQTALKLQQSTSEDKWKPGINTALGCHSLHRLPAYNRRRESSASLLTTIQAGQPSKPALWPKLTLIQWVSGALCHAVRQLEHTTECQG